MASTLDQSHELDSAYVHLSVAASSLDHARRCLERLGRTEDRTTIEIAVMCEGVQDLIKARIGETTP